jgi:class 3 adenylate cyclase/tetratricopeptide (TPR) repeat protein
MQPIAEWLNALGLGQYAQRFADNDIDANILRDLTDADLEKIGVSLGHRKRILRAIAELDEGALVAEPALPGEAQRRQLTVMFCDLVGSTPLSTRLDPEELREIIGAFHRCCAEQIAKCSGVVARYMGDGMLVYFGYPRAHEDDAERAVRAGLALVGAVAQLGDGAGTALRVRVGIATGLVVVGDLLGEGAAQEHQAIGETPNLAARLQGLAEPNAVVIDGNTRRLLGELFEYRPFGNVPLKGFGTPVPVWQVTGRSGVDSRFEALRATRTPLVGRDEEIDLLMLRWQQAKGGEGCVVLISGEPGIGKSRLAQAALERLSHEPHTPLRLFCSPHQQDSALYPAIRQLERAAGFRREDTPELRLDKLEVVLSQATNDLSDVAPLIADLLSVPTGDRYPPINLSPQKRKEETLRALLARVERLAARQPVLFVFEDAHWTDPTSREWLDLTIDRVPTLPVLLIITFRPEFTPPWVGHPQVTLLSLSRLPPRQRALMIMRVTGGKTLPEEITDQIIDRTDGVPLFIEELTKAVVESNLLVDAGDRYTVAGSVPPMAIPTTLQGSLLARLDHLAPMREVAQIAAALGRQFSHELISAIAGMPQRQVDDALGQLVRAELIFRRGVPPDAEYTFKHALVQDAAYSTLLRGRRQQLHTHISAMLERQFPEIAKTRPEILARHCTEAGLIDKAVGYWIKAARETRARHALVEATLQARKGLALLPNLVDGPVRWRNELELQFILAWAEYAVKGEGALEVWEASARARTLCDQLEDRSNLGDVLEMQGIYHVARREYAAGLRVAEDMLQLALEQNHAFREAYAHHLMGRISHWLGEFSRAVGHFERALSVRTSEMNPSTDFFGRTLSADRIQAVALSNLAVDLLVLGYLDQAVALRNQGLMSARKTNHPYRLAVALYWASVVDRLRGAETTSFECLTELATLARQQRFPLFSQTAEFGFGMILSARGKAEEGLARARRAIADIAEYATVPGRLTLLSLAICCEGAGEVDEALQLLDRELEVANATGERLYEAEPHRLKGEWLLAHRPARSAEAEDCYQHALAVARKQQAKFWELRASMGLARLWRDQGKSTEARNLLAPIYGWFTEGLDTPVLMDAKALLDELA